MKYLKTIMRSLKREKGFTLINLLGLSIGMFCFLVTSLFVRDEVAYDRWHENADNIYMSTLQLQREDGEPFDARTSDAFMKALKEESPGVLETVQISGELYTYYQVNDEWIKAPQIRSSLELFKVFDFSLKYGNEETALKDPSDVILSAEIADSIFPGENPVGKTVTFKYQPFGVKNLPRFPVFKHFREKE